MQGKVVKMNMRDLPKHRTPVFNYCRVLEEEGVDPSTWLELYRDHTEPDMRLQIGVGSKLTVEETASGPKFRKYKDVGSSIE